MSHLSGKPAAGSARLALPSGWVELTPTTAQATRGTVQVIALAEWDPGPGIRPTMTVAVTPAGDEHAAVRVLAQAQERRPEVHVVSIDPWRVPGAGSGGRRLVFAHAEDKVTVCTLVWATTTAVGDVVVSAQVESTQLHLHDRTFAEAVAAIQLPDEEDPVPAIPAADLARHARVPSWGEVAPAPQPTAMVADPDARILVEASVGTTALRFDATLVRDHATVSATASPRETVAAAVAGPADAPDPDATTFRVPVTRLALAVAQWLGLGPARTAAGKPVTMPISLVMKRLVDPGTPAPDGVDATAWDQPWFLWTLRSSATDSGLVMVDTGTSGQCAVMETDDEHATRFAPLSTYNVWLTLNWLVAESLVR